MYSDEAMLEVSLKKRDTAQYSYQSGERLPRIRMGEEMGLVESENVLLRGNRDELFCESDRNP